jgi:hypothetical protein
MTNKPDRTVNAVPTANPRPHGGEQTPTNLVHIPEKPAPTSAYFGDFGRKEGN